MSKSSTLPRLTCEPCLHPLSHELLSLQLLFAFLLLSGNCMISQLRHHLNVSCHCLSWQNINTWAKIIFKFRCSIKKWNCFTFITQLASIGYFSSFQNLMQFNLQSIITYSWGTSTLFFCLAFFFSFFISLSVALSQSQSFIQLMVILT